MKMVERTCVWCGRQFQAREADVKRGWAKCCSKSCAASKREKRLMRFGRTSGGTSPERFGRGLPEVGDEDAFDDTHPFSEEAVQPCITFR